MAYVQPVSVGIGQHQMWGFSPSFDPLKYLSEKTKQKKEINVLLINPGDIRHLLETLHEIENAKEVAKVNVYIWEDTLECIAREMILTRIATDQSLSTEARIQTFLEAYGNIEIHKKTSENLSTYAKQIYKDMAKDAEKVAPIFNLSRLKFKERDEIEDVLKFVSSETKFNAKELWDNRSRHYLGARYDALGNIVDWDYSMRMKDYAPIIHKLHYRRWRARGIIVERQGRCTEPNRTLASSIDARHRKRGPVTVRGYWSDIVVSPYISFGVHTRDMSFYERAQRQYKKHSVDICEHNLTKIFEKIAPCNVKEVVEKTPDGEEIQILEAATEVESDTKKEDKKKDPKTKDNEKKEPKSEFDWASRVEVSFLFGDLKKIFARSRYHKLFDLIFISQHIAHSCFSADLNNIAAENCTIVSETVKYLPVKLPEKKLFVQKLVELGTKASWVNLPSLDKKAMNHYSFPMPEENRQHEPADPATATTEKKMNQDSYPECMYPYVFFLCNGTPPEVSK
uniref:Dynein assembly factor 3, axonemal n=1 Tax=Lotharella oceanica TaxID=641309 RepID=A0A7S2TRF5_9EUKA